MHNLTLNSIKFNNRCHSNILKSKFLAADHFHPSTYANQANIIFSTRIICNVLTPKETETKRLTKISYFLYPFKLCHSSKMKISKNKFSCDTNSYYCPIQIGGHFHFHSPSFFPYVFKIPLKSLKIYIILLRDGRATRTHLEAHHNECFIIRTQFLRRVTNMRIIYGKGWQCLGNFKASENH